jgi:hypothetical protein
VAELIPCSIAQGIILLATEFADVFATDFPENGWFCMIPCVFPCCREFLLEPMKPLFRAVT